MCWPWKRYLCLSLPVLASLAFAWEKRDGRALVGGRSGSLILNIRHQFETMEGRMRRTTLREGWESVGHIGVMRLEVLSKCWFIKES